MKEKMELERHFQEIEESNALILQRLKELKPIKTSVQSLPQFPRGAKLPDEIKPKIEFISSFAALQLAIEPQNVNDHLINLPKRYEGIVQLYGNDDQHYSIARLIDKNSQLRKLFFKKLKAIEPESRKRASLTSILFPNVLMQTLHRLIPLTPMNTYRVRSSWCESQSGLKKMTKEEVLAFVKHYFRNLEDWQIKEQELKVATAKNIYKRSNVRLHPQYVVAYDDGNKKRHIAKKSHSPLIIITNSLLPLDYLSLQRYKADESEFKTHRKLEEYKSLIEGTCLVHK
ncbi:DNA replication terminus site-binding protein [Vibrio sp. 1180_3]|uniref:DNA replication terminus site-binding protein n=1 Tax=Vibrio sp. 1180_3 TaxID=2528832 RepID=UPI002404F5A3|nr:DNA replication terminus site-binding protein [Vibrio sp. 1180_3]